MEDGITSQRTNSKGNKKLKHVIINHFLHDRNDSDSDQTNSTDD